MKTYTRKKLAHQEIKDVLDMCRLCLSKLEEGVPIFKDSNDICAVLAMRIMICVGLEMTYEDHLPNKICVNCCQELEKYYKFRRKCEMSYQKLKSHVLAVKGKEKIEEEEAVRSDIITKLPLDDDIQQLLDKQSEKQQNESTELRTKDECMEDVQIPTESESTPDIATFLTTVLKELGVIVEQESGLQVEPDAGPFELDVNGDQMLVELLLEDDEEQTQSPQLRLLEIKAETQISVVTDGAENKQILGKDVQKKNGAWCDKCGRLFSSASAARRHMLSHSEPRPQHVCPACSRTFSQRACRDRHMLVHLAERPYKCPSCPKSFTQRGALRAHARAHAPAAPLLLHRCSLCRKLFLHASGLSRHMLSHAGTMFECSACQRQFNDKSSMIRHVKKSHPNTIVAT